MQDPEESWLKNQISSLPTKILSFVHTYKLNIPKNSGTTSAKKKTHCWLVVNKWFSWEGKIEPNVVRSENFHMIKNPWDLM